MHTAWRDLADAEPEFARAVADRFAANLHHLIATLRRSGAPRISGTEVKIDDEVRVGMMPDSRKLADVGADPRVEIHSAPLEEDLAAGDAKIAGRLVAAGETEGVEGGAAFVVTRWRPDAGLEVTRRR